MRVSIITRGTRGVDMKVNPLTLGATKLRSATNLVFEEGGIKTRPQFKYETLGVRGQFQGAAEYNLAEGISSESFGTGTGLALVVDGKVSVGCEVVGDEFSCKGNVDIYDAENYIVFQNKESHTYWWDGTTLIKSPGTIEEHWDDPDTDWNEQDLTPPVADIPKCRSGESGVTVRFKVINLRNKAPIADALVRVLFKNTTAFEGRTDQDGIFEFASPKRDYSYTVQREDFVSYENGILSVPDLREEILVDGCAVTDLPGGLVEECVELEEFGVPPILVLVLDQTGSIGTAGAQAGIDIIDFTNVKAIGYVSFGDVICKVRPITTDLVALRAELVHAVNRTGNFEFFCDTGGAIPENGVDALSKGCDLIDAFTGIPGGRQSLIFVTDTVGFIESSNDPVVVNERLNNLNSVNLFFGTAFDGSEVGFYPVAFPETTVISYDPLSVPSP